MHAAPVSIILLLHIFYLIGGTTSCKTPWQSFINRCYKADEQLVTFTQAIDVCRAEGASLVHIHSHEEEMFIEENLMLPPDEDQEYTKLWIGGVRVGHDHGDSSFRWLDGDHLNYSNWFTYSHREPNNEDGVENCIALIRSISESRPSGWFDVDCDKKMNPLCVKPADDSHPQSQSIALSLGYEIKSLYQALDYLRTEKHTYESKKWILVTIMTLLLVMITVTCIIADLSEISVTRFLEMRARNQQDGGRETDQIITSSVTSI